MRGQRIKWTKRQLAWIEKNCTMTRRELHAAFQVQFDRPEITYDNIKALCTRRGWKTGRDGRYNPGSIPANKGKKMPYHPNSARTQFKKGRLPHNTKYLGHERVTKDGYVEISIDEKNPHTGYERRYVLKHKYLWEKQNGPIPDGMCLKCLDSNRSNTDPSNWELIPRGALPLMNGFRGPNYDTSDPQVKPVVLTLAKLKHARGAKSRSKNST